MFGQKVMAALCGAVNTCLGCDMIQAGIEASNWWLVVGSVLPIYIAHHCFEISVSPFVNDFVFEPLYRRLFPGREINPNPEDDHLLQHGEDHDEQIQGQGGPMPWNLLQVQLHEGVAPAQARRNLLNEFPELVPDHGELIEQFQPPDHLPNGRPHIMRDN